MQELETRKGHLAEAGTANDGGFAVQMVDPSQNGNPGTSLEVAREELTSEIERLRTWHFWSGPLFTSLAGAALMVTSEYFPSIRPGIVLALLVLYSIFSGGLGSGLVSAAIAAFAINFTYPPHTFLLAPQNYGFMGWHVSSLALVLAVGERLRRSSYRARLADKLNRQLRFEIHERAKVERRLREQNETFVDFVENGSIAMHWVGPDGAILWANQCELDFLGYTREEYIGHNIAEFHADQAVIEDILERLRNDETVRNYEARLRCKDGTIKYVHINSNVRRKDGEFVHTRCFTRDITEVKTKERELLRQARLFNTVASNLPAAIYTTDISGVITFYNEKAAEAWGRQPVVGEDLWCGSWKIFWPDGTPCALEECPMAIALKEQHDVRGMEIIVERPDGTRLWIQPYPTPVFNEDGEMTGALNLLLDITDRKRAEEGQRKAEAEEKRVSDELNQLSRISRILAESRSLEEASWDLLRTACDLTDGYTAAIWLEDDGSLRCADALAIGEGCEDFIEVTRNMIYKPGSGLPGRVLQTHAPVWVYDIASDANLPRKPYAERAGLGSAYAFPLRTGDRINGVLEVFFKGKREFQEERLTALAEAGTRIGIFIERQRAVEAMRDSENRFRALFEQAGVGVVQVDTDGFIIAANERYCEMIGHKPDELRGRKLIEFTHPDDRGKYIYQLGLLWAGDIDRLQIEKRNITSDGRTIWISKTMSLVRDENGEAKYTVAVVQDVTPRIEAQQVVREQQDYLRAVLQNSPVCLAAVDTDGAYRVFSGTALEKLGITASDRLGRTIYEAQRDDADVISWYQRALQGETFVERQIIDGHTFELSFAPHRDEHSKVIGAIAIATDISDRIRDDEALLASEARLRTTLENAPLILTEISKDGIIEFVIGRGLTEAGAEANANVGKSVYETNKDTPERLELFTRALAGEEINSMLIQNDMAFNTFVGPRRNADGEITGVIGVLTNLSDLYHAQKELREREAFLTSVLDSAPFILTFIDTEGIIRLSMGSALTHKGLPVQDLVGQSVYKTYAGNPQHIELFNSALTGNSFRVPIELGDVVYEVSARPYYDEKGSIAGVISIALDVTGTKDVEEMLREREAQLTAIMENTPMVLAMIDKAGTRKMIVGKLLDEFGIDVEPLLGTSVFDDENQRPEVIEAIRHTLDTGEATTFTTEGMGRTFHIFVTPHRDANNNTIGAVTAALDITDTAEKERRLAAAKNELEEWQVMVNTLLGSAPLGVALVDKDVRYLYINEYLAQLNGLSPADHIGRKIHEVIPGEVAEYMESMIRKVYESGEPLLGVKGNAESPMYQGEVRSFEAGMFPLVTADGNKIGVGVIVSDVTEHQRSNTTEQDNVATVEV